MCCRLRQAANDLAEARMRVQLTEAELMNLRGDLLQGEDSRAQLEQLRHELGTDGTRQTNYCTAC